MAARSHAHLNFLYNTTEGANEKKPLVEDTPATNPEDKQYPSIARQRGIIFTVLSLQFISLCADTIIFPFYPALAIEKGLSNTYIELVFAAFDNTKCLFSPIIGSIEGIAAKICILQQKLFQLSFC